MTESADRLPSRRDATATPGAAVERHKTRWGAWLTDLKGALESLTGELRRWRPDARVSDDAGGVGGAGGRDVAHEPARPP